MATTLVAISRTSGAPWVGAPKQMGLVPRNFLAAPQGTMAGLEFVVTMPRQSASAICSA